MRRSIVSGLLFLALLPIASLYGQWIQQPFPSTEYLWKVRFADATTGWVVGHNFVYGTTDGGVTWSPQDSSLGACFALHALSSTTAFYANYASATRGIRRTTDAGATWQTVDGEDIFYNDFEFIDSFTGFAAGGINGSFNPVIRKTTDGGSTWTTVWTDVNHSVELEAISFADAVNGWAITYDGNLYATVDGGATWNLQGDIQPAPPDDYPLRDIQFTSPTHGCAVGGIGGTMLIVQTTDGGSSWVDTTVIGSSLREIQMVNSQVGWFAGLNNGPPYIARTTDGGNSWVEQTLVPNRYVGFESISMVDENLGWAVGPSGYIYKTTNGGVVSVPQQTELPSHFRLSENYPNPFNPTTAIRYELTAVSQVRLTVYNLLGQEVATLVNERKDAGTYTVTWDASRFPSGVYVYRLNAGNLVESRKAILIK